MQWEYKATRDDELSAAAGEAIIVAGEYKNPGWVWASRIGPNGQATGGYRLCPANYFLFAQQPAQPSSSLGAVGQQSQLPISMQQQQPAHQQLPSSMSISLPSQLSAAAPASASEALPAGIPGDTAREVALSGTGARQDFAANLSGTSTGNERITNNLAMPHSDSSSTGIFLNVRVFGVCTCVFRGMHLSCIVRCE
jgi:hypothetical protein